MRFLSLVKPGIIFGNAVTVCGGFFMASRGHPDWKIFAAAMVGMCLIIACGCVFNNYIDQDIDRLMDRTKKRPMAQKTVSGPIAISYAIVLGILGFLLLYFETNMLTFYIAVVGLFFYVVAYTLWTKRTSHGGTLVGAISGAVPPMAGYCAVTNHLDAGAWIVFAILFFWQMPHFYAIAIFRFEDYKRAKIPVLPVVKGIEHTKVYMVLYTVPFTVAAMLPSVFGYTGLVYFFLAFTVGVLWFVLGVSGLYTKENKKWARKMFALSIIIITLLSVMMAVNPFLI